MKKTFTLLLAFTFSTLCFSQVYVKQDATGANDGTSWADAYTDLTAAIAATSEGDQLWVAAGVYKPDGSLPVDTSFFQFPHDLELYGGFDGTETILSERDWFANETILSGDHNDDDVDDDFSINKTDNSYHVMWLTDTITTATIIDGITVKNGNSEGADGAGNDRRAGGILAYGGPTVRNCRFENNYGYFGGAFYPRGSDAAGFLLEDCVFINNRGQFGAAVYDLSSLGMISNCTFSMNSVEGRGGCIYTNESNTTISECMFSNNSASTSSGGAIQVRADDEENNVVDIIDCTFTNNDATFGGAIGIYDSTAVVNVTDCTFEENFAVNVGAAISVAFQATANISNSTFTSNNSDLTGGAIFVQNDNSTLHVDECLFQGNLANRGAGLAFSGSNELDSPVGLMNITIENSIIRGNSAVEQGGGINVSNAKVELINCLIDGNLTTDPEGIGGGISFNNSFQMSSTYSLMNCTIANNLSPNGAGISNWQEAGSDSLSVLTVQNTIIKNPLGDNYLTEAEPSTVISNGGNLSSDFTLELLLVGTNDIHAENPLFVDPSDLSLDLRLSNDSPCIDTGIADGAPDLDLDGNSRVGEVDMGSYENQQSVSVAEALSKFGTLKILPNVVENDLRFSFTADINGPLEVQIISRDGRIFLNDSIEKNSAELQGTYHVSDLSAGIYFLTISDGELMLSKTFVKL